MSAQKADPRTTRYAELFVFYRDGKAFHIHHDRSIFDLWMKDATWQFPKEKCEIVRFVPEEGNAKS